MYFRPFPVLTVIAIPALAALLWLGSWQAGRAEWKAGLIEEYEEALASEPLDFGKVLCALPGASGISETNKPIHGSGVMTAMLGGWPPQGRSVRMFSQTSGGEAGWYKLFAGRPPGCLADEGAIIVQGYFEPFNPAGAQERPFAGLVDFPPSRYLVREWPGKPPFTAANSPETNDWHWFDAPAMAKALDVPKLNNRFYLATFSGDLPAYLSRTPPATHIGYSVTWYGMAIAFAVIYALFHARAGRLRFGKRDPAQ
jgi:surfeit locus 1 family protein